MGDIDTSDDQPITVRHGADYFWSAVTACQEDTVPDYRLEGLSPRAFEHLVQSLAIAEISRLATPFGDGPDGGREAAFSGATDYGPHEARWNGYGVIQAKFRQRPSRDDGTWAVRELQKELKRFVISRRPRKIPNYYIYAVNVVLTPAEESGSKDQVFALLTEFADRHGLHGFDVWDYDKIRVLLDNNEQVRRANAAWITAGDVLSDLAQHLQAQRHDYHRIVRSFLQKELLSDQYARLEQAGHSADESIPLSQVFVDLPISSEPVSNLQKDGSTRERYVNFAAAVIDAADARFDDRGDAPPSQPSIDKGWNRSGRYVLIGGPGQGKTTLGQLICQIFRTALLVDVDNRLVDPQARIAMEGIVSQWSSGSLPKPSVRRLPFRIVLSEFAKKLSNGEASSVLDYLGKQVGRAAGTPVSAQDMIELMKSHPTILILDGLDEVPPSTNRTQVLESVRDFRVDITSEQLDVLVLATSRPQGYNEDFSPGLYDHRYLVPLPPKVALGYATKLTNIRFGQDSGRRDKVISRLERAASSPSTARLMQSPLQATIMTLLVDRMGQPPQERWALFNEYYNLIYQREIEREIPAAAILRDYRADINAIHRQVGLILQMEGERSGGTDSKLSSDQFCQIVDGYLEEEGHDGERRDRLRDSIIEAAANRLVFLVGLESDQVGFEIRSLQEFMAAEGLMDADDGTTQKRLREIAGITNWRNVFLFAAGICFAERRHLRDTVAQICIDLNESVDDPLCRPTLAGSRLALDLLEDGSAARQPTKCRALTRLALRLLDVDDPELQNRVFGVYQELTSDIYKEELSARLQSSATHQREVAVAGIARLSDVAKEDVGDLLGKIEAHLKQLSEEEVVRLAQLGDGGPGNVRDAVIGAMSRFQVNETLRILRLRNAPLWVPPRDRPAWLSSLMLIASPTRELRCVRAPLRNSANVEVGIVSVRSVEQSMGEKLVHVRDLCRTDGGWPFLNATISFLLEPSARTLTAAARAAFSADPNDVTMIRNFLATWPLAVVLQQLPETNGEGVTSLVEQLGDLGDWRDFETRFATGLTLDELAQYIPTLAMDNFVVRPTEEAVAAIVDFVAPYVGEPWVDRIAWSLGEVASDHSQSRNSEATRAWTDDVLKILFAASFPFAVLSALRRIGPTNPADPSWTPLIRRIRNPWMLPVEGIAAYRLYEMVRASWEREPSSELLTAWAICAQSKNLPFVEWPKPELMNSTPDDISRFCRLLLLLRRGIDVEDLARDLRGLSSSKVFAVSLILEVLQVTQGETADFEASVLKLHRVLSTTSASDETMATLQSIVSARQSRLMDEMVWADLAFPPKLRRVVAAMR